MKPGEGLTYSFATDSPVKKGFINTIEIFSGRKKLRNLYRDLEKLKLKDKALWDGIIQMLDIRLDLNYDQIAKIPAEGPVIVIANHPFGVVDGLILGHILAQRRADFTIVVHEALTREAMMKPYVLPIDFRDTKEALKTNIETRRQCITKLQNEEAIAIFPSGAVSTTPKITDKVAEDLEWKRFTAKILVKSEATVVPIFFHGQNSPIFQVASHINQNFRYALLLGEVKNKMGKTIKVDVHDPIPFSSLPQGLKRQELLDYLKEKTLTSV